MAWTLDIWPEHNARDTDELLDEKRQTSHSQMLCCRPTIYNQPSRQAHASSSLVRLLD